MSWARASGLIELAGLVVVRGFQRGGADGKQRVAKLLCAGCRRRAGT